ncbi:TRAP transporter small permease [Mesorhizobium sp. CAU 1732]|uniref:TRAP transporter small permease n=1 Tax=Mesorhizobium sp. CAU 1732 TaxID=3140358 RepID=UPI003261CA0D
MATALLCGSLLIALTFVTVVDVFGRYLLLRPLPGAPEYTELLLMAIIFTGLPAVCLDDGHVSVDLFTSKFTGWLAAVQLASARLAVSVVLAIVAWQLWEHAVRLATYNEVTVFLRMPLAPFCKGAAVIAGVSSLATFVMACLRLSRGREGGI